MVVKDCYLLDKIYKTNDEQLTYNKYPYRTDFLTLRLHLGWMDGDWAFCPELQRVPDPPPDLDFKARPFAKIARPFYIISGKVLIDLSMIYRYQDFYLC